MNISRGQPTAPLVKAVRICVAAAGFAAAVITPALADDETETRNLAEFDAIVIQGAVDLEIDVGKPQRVEITTDERQLSRIETSVSGGTLTINQEGRRWFEDVEIRISVAALNRLNIQGAADAEVRNIESDDFRLEIDGAGDITFDGGSCGRAEMVVNGAGDIDAETFECREVRITINGAGDASVYASESVEAYLNGVGDITVYGNPSHVRPRISGLGSFEVVE